MKKLNCIMLIDDNDDDNYYHQIILNEINASDKIQVAESGFQALEYLKGENEIPQLIFLDINMPKMNGWEFLEEYAKLNIKKISSVIIIMLTTSLNPADKEKAKTIKIINGFESKPLTEDMVFKIIEKHF